MELEGKVINKNKKKQLIYALFLTSLLIMANLASSSIVIAQETTMYKTFMKTPQPLCLDTIGVEKTVWDNTSESWSESTIVPEGEIVVFNVSIYNPYDEYLIHFGGKVIDILPCNLFYINGSSTIYEESGWPNLEEVYWEENKVVWPQAPTIYPHEYLNFTYSAQAISCGSEFLKNNLTVIPGFLEHIYNSSNVIYNNGSLNVWDTASILVSTPGIPIADFTYEPCFPIVNHTVWFNSTSFDSDGTIESYFWEFGDGANSTQENTTHQYQRIGEYSVGLEVTDNEGLTNQINKSIRIIAGEPIITYVFPADNATNINLLPPLIIEVFDTDSSEIHIQWWSNVTGTWEIFGQNISAPNKMFTQKQIEFNAYNTTYWWAVTITDGIFWTNATYRFNTRKEIIDTEAPTLLTDFSDKTGTTGDPLLFSILVEDDLDDAAALFVSVLWGEQSQLQNDTMQWNTSSNLWELSVLIPSNSSSCYYWFYLRDTSGNTRFLSGNYSPIPINDNDPPWIENIIIIPKVQEPMKWVNISASIFDNIAMGNGYIQINGPLGFIDLNESMIQLGDMWFFNRSYASMGTYTFTIWAEDTEGNANTSEEALFNITNFPEKPQKPSGLQTVKRRKSAGYYTEGFDVDGDLIQFRFDWNAAGSHSYSEWSDFIDPESLTLDEGNASITMYHSWNQAGSYSVQAQSRDIYGAMSPWSDPLSVRVTGTSNPGYSGDPPVANMSAGEPYEGFVNDIILFDGSYSRDEDGTIVEYSWEFGDGTNAKGEKVTHTYKKDGSFTIILTVKDNDDKTDSCKGTATITQLNRPPETPIIQGETDGSVNTTYSYTLRSFDADNDSIRFILNWDDGNSFTTDFVASNMSTNITHQWITPNAYFITVLAEDDENARSGTKTVLVLIDVDIHFINNGINGYLLDKNKDGIFDLFHNNASNMEIPVERLENGSYLIDADGDGIWDYLFDPDTNTLNPYKEAPADTEDETDYTALCITIFILLFLILLILYLYLNRKDKQKKEKTDDEINRFKIDVDEEAPSHKKELDASSSKPLKSTVSAKKSVGKKKTETVKGKTNKKTAKKKNTKAAAQTKKGTTTKKSGKKTSTSKKSK